MSLHSRFAQNGPKMENVFHWGLLPNGSPKSTSLLFKLLDLDVCGFFVVFLHEGGTRRRARDHVGFLLRSVCVVCAVSL